MELLDPPAWDDVRRGPRGHHGCDAERRDDRDGGYVERPANLPLGAEFARRPAVEQVRPAHGGCPTLGRRLNAELAVVREDGRLVRGRVASPHAVQSGRAECYHEADR